MNTSEFVEKLPLSSGCSVVGFDACGILAISKKAGRATHPNPNPSPNAKPPMLRARYNFDGEYYSWNDPSGEKMRLYLVNRLDSPTANLSITDGVLPPNGVYAGFAHVDGVRYPAAVNLGVSPTFRAEYGRISRRLELHLLGGFHGTLYGKYLQAELVSFLRPEKRFADPEELKQQIRRDIEAINQILEGK